MEASYTCNTHTHTRAQLSPTAQKKSQKKAGDASSEKGLPTTSAHDSSVVACSSPNPGGTNLANTRIQRL